MLGDKSAALDIYGTTIVDAVIEDTVRFYEYLDNGSYTNKEYYLTDWNGDETSVSVVIEGSTKVYSYFDSKNELVRVTAVLGLEECTVKVTISYKKYAPGRSFVITHNGDLWCQSSISLGKFTINDNTLQYIRSTSTSATSPSFG
jgi:hypothetical protein